MLTRLFWFLPLSHNILLPSLHIETLIWSSFYVYKEVRHLKIWGFDNSDILFYFGVCVYCVENIIILLNMTWNKLYLLQIRSHAQKYFLKAQKSGTNEHLPPPRPKRKAAHPYPQKASKTGNSASFLIFDWALIPAEKLNITCVSEIFEAPLVSQAILSFQVSPAVPDPGSVRMLDSSSVPEHPDTNVSLHSWTDNSIHSTNFPLVARGSVLFFICHSISLPDYLRTLYCPYSS